MKIRMTRDAQEVFIDSDLMAEYQRAKWVPDIKSVDVCPTCNRPLSKPVTPIVKKNRGRPRKETKS